MNYFSTLDPYPEYFTSEIQLVEQIPSHWNIRKLKYTIRGCTNGIWGEPPNGDENDVVCIRVADFNRHNRSINLNDLTYRNIPKRHQKDRLLKVGDLLLEKSGGGENQPVGCVVLINQEIDAVTSNFIARMPIRDGFESRFLNYLHWHLYDSKINTKSIKQTTGIQNIDQDAYLSEKVGIPPLPEQRAIADFLDHQTTKIDALIEKQERLIELLEEKRNALIAQAVTKGLDPDVPMKDSGVEWLGEIPEHWSIRRLKFLSKINPSISERNDLNENIDVSFLPMENLGEGNIEVNLTKKLFEVRTGFTYFVENDVLIAKITPSFENNKGAIAKNLANKIGFGTTELHIIRANKKIIPEFLFLVTSSYHFRIIGTHYMKGVAGQQRVDKKFLTNFPFAFPNIKEQHKIVDFINNFDEDQTKLKNKITLLIEKLHKYRETIITSAVTGKIDVRDWQEKEVANLE